MVQRPQTPQVNRIVGASPWVYPRETGLLSPNPKPPVLDDADPTNADPTPASPPQDGGSEGRGTKGRKEGMKKATHFDRGMGRYQGSFRVSLAQQGYSTGKRAASVGTRLGVAAENTLPYSK